MNKKESIKVFADYVQCRLRLMSTEAELKSAKEEGALSGNIEASAWRASTELETAGASIPVDMIEGAICELRVRYGLMDS